MKPTSRIALALVAMALAAQVSAQATFYEDEAFAGRTLTASSQVADFERFGLGNRASSIVIVGDPWQVCQAPQFSGQCVVLRPGRYASLAAQGLNDRIASARVVSQNSRDDDGRSAPVPVAGQVVFYEREGFDGRSFTTKEPMANLRRSGFNERAASVVVSGERWEVCDDSRFRGRCVVLRPGRYASLTAMGLNDRIASMRVVDSSVRIADDRYAPLPASGSLNFFEDEGFAGRSFMLDSQVANLQNAGFNDRASSAVVVGARWEVCDDADFRGRCVVLRPGRYASLAAMGLNNRVSSVRALAQDARIADHRYAPEPIAGQVAFFENEGFAGRSFTTQEPVANLRRSGFNDRASSAVVIGDRWEVCDDPSYAGRCVVLRPGRYDSLAAMGLNDRISSVRALEWNARVGDDRYAPAPIPVYDSRPRRDERLYEADVTSARAVLATSGQRCWVEREQVPQAGGSANVPAAIAGAIIGGVLGHQVGGGTGKDIATVGGAVAGAAVGANVGRSGGAVPQDVQRCENVPGGAQPAYWDVAYTFRGRDHRVQMAAAPASTIIVNEQGEPRQ
jgi:uncharacterized protein YcfJ